MLIQPFRRIFLGLYKLVVEYTWVHTGFLVEYTWVQTGFEWNINVVIKAFGGILLNGYKLLVE